MGNVGGKLAGSLVRNGHDVTVHDLKPEAAAPLVAAGAAWAETSAHAAQFADTIITCLPSPEISAKVMEGDSGIIQQIRPGDVWLEMSTTDHHEVLRLGNLVQARGGYAADCPVSGGCHRAATGNISIFAGCRRETFERILPLLCRMGRKILHTGPLGTASILKVVTNYLATANLVSLCEALITSKAAGLDLNTAYNGIQISSGNSFVHETESQVILNGTRDINFTMGLVSKDVGLFNTLAEQHDLPLEISPLLAEIFNDGMERFGPNEWSPNIIKRLEEATGLDIRAPGFPNEIVDDEQETTGNEVAP